MSATADTHRISWATRATACALALLAAGCVDESGRGFSDDFDYDAWLAGGAGADAGGGEADAPPTGTLDGALEYGRQCAGCHSAEATGIPGASPSVRFPIRDYATWVVRSGRQSEFWSLSMPAFSEEALPEAALEAIFDHLWSLPRPEDGAGLYGAFCANCHGPDGKSGPADEDLTDVARDKPERVLERVREGHGAQRYDDRDDYMPAFGEDALSDDEVQLIVEHLQSL